jgi:gamma-glutamyltranspeptidase
VKEGDTIKRPKLAHTLERIANDGIEPFYSGKIADDIINTVGLNLYFSQIDPKLFSLFFISKADQWV